MWWADLSRSETATGFNVWADVSLGRHTVFDGGFQQVSGKTAPTEHLGGRGGARASHCGSALHECAASAIMQVRLISEGKRGSNPVKVASQCVLLHI